MQFNMHLIYIGVLSDEINNTWKENFCYTCQLFLLVQCLLVWYYILASIALNFFGEPSLHVQLLVAWVGRAVSTASVHLVINTVIFSLLRTPEISWCKMEATGTHERGSQSCVCDNINPFLQTYISSTMHLMNRLAIAILMRTLQLQPCVCLVQPDKHCPCTSCPAEHKVCWSMPTYAVCVCFSLTQCLYCLLYFIVYRLLVSSDHSLITKTWCCTHLDIPND